MGRLEGLQAVPVPSDLQYNSEPALNVTVRAGAFHSDRLRYGRFLVITSRDQEILIGALHPTVYSTMHPSMVFEIAALGPNSWMVSFDFSPLIIESLRDGMTPPPAWTHVSKLLAKYERIRTEASPLSVPIRIPEDKESAIASLCILSSAQLPMGRKNRKSVDGGDGGGDSGTRASLDRFKSSLPSNDVDLYGIPLHAFKSALSTYLNSLVTAPLDGSVGSILSVTAEHAAQVERMGGALNFLGCDVLKDAFGSLWVSRLRNLVLDDGYGLPSGDDLEAMVKRETAVSSSEFIYFNPRKLSMD